MKSRIIYTLLCGTLLFADLARGQSIRKDYREFTQQEMTDYVGALNSLFSAGTISSFASSHAMHFTSPIHTTGGFNGEQFFPWHRFFLIDLEQRIRGTQSGYAYLSVPYWDWTTDQNNASSNFWHNGFLNMSNFSGWGFTRNVGAAGSLASPANISTALGLTTFFTSATSSSSTSPDFAHRVEHWHNLVHVYVGGTMNSTSSPLDPIFYLHHNMVDKLWQKWEDASTNIQSSFPNGTMGLHHYSPPDYPINVTLNAMRDSRDLTRPSVSGSGRNLDVWFAENGKVLIDGANGSAFVASDVNASYIYRYTAATSPGATTFGGKMYVGDIQRDASDNVIDDTKGGFEINSSVKVNFLAGDEIVFMNGFWAKSGSDVVAKIIATVNETAPLQRSGSRNAPIVTLLNSDRSDASGSAINLKVFPNPVRSKAYVQYSVSAISKVSLTVTDVTGRIVKTSSQKTREPGNYTEEINLADLPGGIYMCNFIVGSHKSTFKLIK